MTNTYAYVRLFHIVPQLLDFFKLYSLLVSVWVISFDLSSSFLFLSSPLSSLLRSLLKALFISIAVFLFLLLPFDSYNFHLC